MCAKKHKPAFSGFDSIVCSLQGGGALGAYQVGVLKALHEAGYLPDWFVGTSIGAINAAICAGNRPKDRVDKLVEFWDRIASHNMLDAFVASEDVVLNRILNYWSAQTALVMGQLGFFQPRFPPPYLSMHDDPQLLSYYDTTPLKNTLEELIDFEWLNSGEIRLTLGAVEITTGEIVYFDTQKTAIQAEHIMASGALPPGFPAVEVDGKMYWDGGLSSNTPVTQVLQDRNAEFRLCFMVHLFDSYGMKPESLDEVLKRKKDIEFSSRFLRLLELQRVEHKLRHQIHYLSKLLNKDTCNEPMVKQCAHLGWSHKIALVRFLLKGDEVDLSSKDYEFSSRSIKRHIENGHANGKRAIKKSVWNQDIPDSEGIALYDMADLIQLGGTEQ